MKNGAHSVSNAVITKKVKEKIGEKYSAVNVETKDGLVKLEGKVNANSDADILVQYVESVDGVKDVDTRNLVVNGSKHVISDSLITAKIKGRFIKAKLLDEKITNPWIGVETTNGIVYLSGHAESQKHAHHAVELAKLVGGVKKVDATRLTVNKN